MMVGVVCCSRSPMSATSQTTPVTSNISKKAHKLATFLEEKVAEEGGVVYVKAKFISEDVGLSSKEIGALMLQLQDCELSIEVEPWSYTGATTWRISAVNAD